MTLQRFLEKKAEDGSFRPVEYPLNHYFTSIDEKYGCCSYARVIFFPKGHIVIGKIHKKSHLVFMMKGKIRVGTETIEAPAIFVSEAGVKRAAIILEDTIWATVHMTEHYGEENLDKMEEEVIAKSYEELGLIDEVRELEEPK